MKIPKELYKTIIADVEDENIVKTLDEMLYRDYLRTNYWRELKKIVHKILGKKCEACGKTKDIQIHHLNYYNKGKETFNDIACLCGSCHLAMHRNEGQLFHPIGNRTDFNKLLKMACKIKKNFNNKRYIKLLPLTRKPFWTAEQLSEFWDEDIFETTKLLNYEVNKGLITEFTLNDDKYSNYCIKHFIWYLIEFDYPKIPEKAHGKGPDSFFGNLAAIEGQRREAHSDTTAASR